MILKKKYKLMIFINCQISEKYNQKTIMKTAKSRVKIFYRHKY